MNSKNKFYFINGNNVYLRPFKLKDISKYDPNDSLGNNKNVYERDDRQDTNRLSPLPKAFSFKSCLLSLDLAGLWAISLFSRGFSLDITFLFLDVHG